MSTNQVIQTLLDHRSIRKYSLRKPSEGVIRTVVRAGQQAPFSSQLYSLLLSKNRAKHPFHAPLLFTVCVDPHKFEAIMARRGWKLITNDLTLLLFGIQDASLMAENMVIAGRSLGLGSCFLGSAMYNAERIAKEYSLPAKVFPLVQLAMGYPAEDPHPRPRYPIEFTLFDGKYPELTDELVGAAMDEMDEGYLRQDYYRTRRAKIPLASRRKDPFGYEDYSWTEHISRKWGQWYRDPGPLIKQLEGRGFRITKRK